MNGMQKLVSSMGDVLNLIMGKDFVTPMPQALEQYQQSNNPRVLTLDERYTG